MIKYDAIFPNEVDVLVANDWIMNLLRKKQDDFLIYWRNAIENHIEFEKKRLSKAKEPKGKRQLTHEKALESLVLILKFEVD